MTVVNTPNQAKAAARAAWAMGGLPQLRQGNRLGPRRRARAGVRYPRGATRPRRRGGDREHGDPRRRDRRDRRRLRPDPENFAAGRAEARARGVELTWVQADAEALRFANDEFDVVTSSFGAIFAPDHEAVADEMLRVLRPGGTIGMLNFTPEGLITEFFGVLGPYGPPSEPAALSPAFWGSEDHVRQLLGDRVESLEMARRHYVERAASPHAYRELYKRTFGPVVAIYQSIAARQDVAEALDRDFLEFAIRANTGSAGGAAEYRPDYLLVLARKRSARSTT